MKIADLYKYIAVESGTGCWVWQRAVNNKGYGVCYLLGRQRLAHRVSYEVSTGQDAGDLFVLHSCDNPKCINPSHLRAGTQRDNVQDAKMRNRHINPPRITSNPEWVKKWKSSVRKGEDVHNSKLNEPIVREIWRLHFDGLNASQISERIGFSVAAISDVCRGRSWRHLDGAPSIEALKQGGVRRGAFNQFTSGGDTRAINSRTKIPSSEIPAILGRLADGETLKAIGASYGVTKHAIHAIKRKYAA